MPHVEPDGASAPAMLAASPKPATSRAGARKGDWKRDPARREGARLAAALAAEARAACAARGEAISLNAIAAKFGVSKTILAGYFDPQHGADLTLGMLVAGMPRALARAILVRALAHLESAALARTDLARSLRELTVELGRATEAFHADVDPDGRLDDHDVHAAHLLRIAEVALRAHAVAKAAGGTGP